MWGPPAQFLWSGKEYTNQNFLARGKPGGELKILFDAGSSDTVCLFAEMTDSGDGTYKQTKIDLQERIIIANGELRYVRNGLTLKDGRAMHGALTNFLKSGNLAYEGAI